MDTMEKIMLNLVNYKYARATEWRKCKHVFPLKFTILDLECEAITMGPTVTITSHLMKMFGCLPLRKERVAKMCNSLDPGDLIVQDTCIL
jgi:hypothetical protein